MPSLAKVSYIVATNDVNWLTSFHYQTEGAEVSAEDLQDLMMSFYAQTIEEFKAMMTAETTIQGCVGFRLDPKLGIPLFYLSPETPLEPGEAMPAQNACCITLYSAAEHAPRNVGRTYVSGIPKDQVTTGRLQEDYVNLAQPWMNKLKLDVITTNHEWELCTYGLDKVGRPVVQTHINPRMAIIKSRQPRGVL